MQNYLLTVPRIATAHSSCSSRKAEGDDDDDDEGIATSRSPLGWMTDESSMTMMRTPSACSPLPLTDASSGTNNTFLLTPSLCSTQPSPSMVTPPSQQSQQRLHTLHHHYHHHSHHVPDSLLRFGEGWSDPNAETTSRQTPPMSSHWFIPVDNCSFSGDLDGATPVLSENITRERVTTEEALLEALESHSTNGKDCLPESRNEKEGEVAGRGEPMMMHHPASNSQTGYTRGQRWSRQNGFGFWAPTVDPVHCRSSPLSTPKHSHTLETNPNALNQGQSVKGAAMDRHPKKEEEGHDKNETNHLDLALHPRDHQGSDASHSKTNTQPNNNDNDNDHYLVLRKRMYSPPHFTSTLNEDVLLEMTAHGPYPPAVSRYRQYSSPPLSPKGIKESVSGTRQVGSPTRSPMRLRGAASSSTTSSCTLDGMSRTHLVQHSRSGSGAGNNGITGTNTSINNSCAPRNSNNVNNHPSLELVDSGSAYGCNNLTFPLSGNTVANRLFVQTMAEARGVSDGDGARLTEVCPPTDGNPVAVNIHNLSNNNSNSNHLSGHYHREGRVPSGSCLPSNTIPNTSLGSPAPPPIKVWDEGLLPPTPLAVRWRGISANFHVTATTTTATEAPMTHDHPQLPTRAAPSIQSSQCVTSPASTTATTVKTSMPLEAQNECDPPCSTTTNAIKEYFASSAENSPTNQHQRYGGFPVEERGQAPEQEKEKEEEEEEEGGHARGVGEQPHQWSRSSGTPTVTITGTPTTATFNVTVTPSSSTPVMIREQDSQNSTSNHPPQPPPLSGAALFTSSRLSYLGSGREDPLTTPLNRKGGRRSPSSSPIGSPTLVDDPWQEAHSPHSPRSKGLHLQHTTLPAGGSSRSSSVSSSLRHDSGSPCQNTNNNTNNNNNSSCTNQSFGNGGGLGAIIHPRSTSCGSQELGKNPAHSGVNVVHRVPGSGSSSDVTSLLRIQVSNSGFPLLALVGLENSFTSGVDGGVLRSPGVPSPHRRLSPCRLSSLHHQNTPTTPSTFVTVISSNPSMNTNNNLTNPADHNNTNNANTNIANTNSIRCNNNNHSGAQFQNLLRLSLTDEEVQSLLPVGATPPSLVGAAPSIAFPPPTPELTPALSVTVEHHQQNKPQEVTIAGRPLRDRFPAFNEPVTTIPNTESAAQPAPPLPLPPHPDPHAQSRPSIRTPSANTSVLADYSSAGGVDGLVTKLPSPREDTDGATDRQSLGRRSGYGQGASSFDSRFGQNAMMVGGGSTTMIRRGTSAGNSSQRYNAVSIQRSSGGFSLNRMTAASPIESGDMVFEGVMANPQSGSASVQNDVVTDAQPVSDEGGILLTARDGAKVARPHTAASTLLAGASSTALPRRRRSSLRVRPLNGMSKAGDGNPSGPPAPLPPSSGGANDHQQDTESAVESSSPCDKSVMVSWSDHHNSPTVADDPTHEADNKEHHLAGTVTNGSTTVTFTFGKLNSTNSNSAIEMNDDAQGELKKANNTSFNCNLSVGSTLRRNSGDLMAVRSLRSGGSNNAFFSGVAPSNSTSPALMSLFQPPLPPPPPLSKNDGGGSVSHILMNTSKNGIIQSSTDSSCSSSTATEGSSTKVSIIHHTDDTGTHYTVRPGHRRRRQSRRSSHTPRFTINVPAREDKAVVKLSTVECEGGLSENGISSQQREDLTKISSTAKPSKNMSEKQPTGTNDTVCGEPSTTSLLHRERDEETSQPKEKAEDSTRAGEDNHIIVESSNQLSTSAFILRALRLGGGGGVEAEGGGALLHTPTSLLSEGGFHRLSMVTPTSLAMANINYNTADDVESPEEGVNLLDKNDKNNNGHNASIPERNPLGLVSVKASGTHESEIADSMVSGLGAESFRSDILPSFSFGGGRFVYEDSLGMNESGSRYMYSVVNYIPNNDNNNNTNVNNNRMSHFMTSPPLPVGSSPTAALPNGPLATWAMQSASRTAGGAWQYLPSASIGSVASAAGFCGLFHNLQRQSENLGHLFYISDDDEMEEDDEEEEMEEIEEECEEEQLDGPAEIIPLEKMAGGGMQDSKKTTGKKRRAKRAKHGRQKSKDDAFGPLGESFAADALVNELGNRNSFSAFGAMLEPQRRDHYREQGLLNGSVASVAEVSPTFHAVAPQNAVVNLPSTSGVGNPRSRHRSGALRPSSVMSSVPSFAISSPNTLNTACSFVWTPNQPLTSAPYQVTTLQRFPLMGCDMASTSFGVLQNGAPEDRYGGGGSPHLRGYSVGDPGYDLEPMPDHPSPYRRQVGASGEHMSSQPPPNTRSGYSPISADRQSVASTAGIVFIPPYHVTGSGTSVNFPTTKTINEAEPNGSMEEQTTVADIPLNTRSKPENTKEHGNETDGGGEDGKPSAKKRLTSVSYRQRDEGLIKNTFQWARNEADRRGHRLAPGTQEQSTVNWMNNASTMASYDSNLYGSMLSVSSFSAGTVGNIVFPHPVAENSVCTATSDASPIHQSSEGALSENVSLPAAQQPLPAMTATPQTGLNTPSHLLPCDKTETMNTAIMPSDREPLIHSFISPDMQNYSDSGGGRFFRFPSNADVERTPSRVQESSSCASPKAPVQRFSTAAQGAFDSRATIMSTNKMNSFEVVTQTTTVSTNACAGMTGETELMDPQHIIPSAPSGGHPDHLTSAGSGSQSVPMFLNILTGSDLSLLEIPVPLASLAGSGITGISVQLGSSGFSSSTVQNAGQALSCSGLSNVFSKAKSSQEREQKLFQQGSAVVESGGCDTQSETSMRNTSPPSPSPSPSPCRPTQPPLASVAVVPFSTERNAYEMCSNEKGNTDCRPSNMEEDLKNSKEEVEENRELVACTGCENESDAETSIGNHSPLDASRNHDHNPVALMLPHPGSFNASEMSAGCGLSARAESGTAGGSVGLSYQSISFSKGPGVVSTTMIQVPDSPRFHVHNNTDLVNASMPIPLHHTSSSMVSSSPRVEEAVEGNVVPHSPLDNQLPSSPRNRHTMWLSSTSRAIGLPSPINLNTTTTTANNKNTTMTTTKDHPTTTSSTNIGQNESLSSAAIPHSTRPLPLTLSPLPQGCDAFDRHTSLFSQQGGGGCSGDASTISSSPRPPQRPHSPPGMPSPSSPCRRLSLFSINSLTSPTAGTRVAAFATTPTPEPQPTGSTAHPDGALSKKNEKHRMKLLSSPLPRSISTDSSVREGDLGTERSSSVLMTPTVRLRNPHPTPSNSPQTSLNHSNHHHSTTTTTTTNNNNNNSTTAANTNQQRVPPPHPPPSLNSSLPLLSLVPPTSSWSSPPNLSAAVFPVPASTPHAARPPTAAALSSSSAAGTAAGTADTSSITSPIPHLLLHPLRTSANTNTNTNHRSNSTSSDLTLLTTSTVNGNLAAAPPTTNAGPPPLPTPTSTSPIMTSRARLSRRASLSSIGGEPSLMAVSLLQDGLPHPIESVSSTVDFPSSSFPLRQLSKSPSLGSHPHTHHSEESGVMDREDMEDHRGVSIPVNQVETPIKAKGSWRMRRNPLPPHSPHQPPHPYPPSLLHASHGIVGNQPTGFPSSSLVGDTFRGSQMETPSICGGPPSVNQTALSSPVTAQMIGGLPTRAGVTGTSGTIVSAFKGIAPEDGSRASATTLVTSPKLLINAHNCTSSCSLHLQPVIRIPSSHDHVMRGSREEECCDVVELPPPLCVLRATSENPSEERGCRGHSNLWDTNNNNNNNNNNNVNDNTSTTMTRAFSTSPLFQLAATGSKREVLARAEATPFQQEPPLHPPPPQEEEPAPSTPHAPPLSPPHYHHYGLHKGMDATPRRPSMEMEKPECRQGN